MDTKMEHCRHGSDTGGDCEDIITMDEPPPLSLSWIHRGSDHHHSKSYCSSSSTSNLYRHRCWQNQHRTTLKFFRILMTITLMMTMTFDCISGKKTSSGQRLPQRFEMEPIDKTAIVGDTVILPCRVANKVGTLQWTRDGFGLGTERTLEGFQRYRMVGSDDEGDYSLEISPVALEDDAVFQCQVGAVDGIQGIRSRSAKFTVQVPPEPPVIVVTHAHSHAQVYKSDSGLPGASGNDDVTLSVSAPDGSSSGSMISGQDHHLRTTAGMTIELTCEAHAGRPPAELTWMDSSGNPITDGVSYSTTKLNDGKRWNAALKWTVVASRALDGQRVTCRSENAALKSPRYAHIRLEVRYAPEVQLRIASIDDNGGGVVREGDDLTLECIAAGNPSRMTFKWTRDGAPIDSDGDIVGPSSGDGTPRLIFRRIGREFHGTVIACEVANSVGTSRAPLEIKVAFKPRFSKPPEQAIGLAKNENIRLTCNVDSYPPAHIYWSKYSPKLTLDTAATDNNGSPGATIHGERDWEEIGQGSTLEVSSAGRYRCRAKNPAFDDELKGETLVYIKGAPLIRSPSVQYGVENEPVRLQCIVEAVPHPKKITWYKLNHGSTSSTYQQIEVDNNEGYEILEELDPEDFSSLVPSPSYLMSSNMASSGTGAMMIDTNHQMPSSLALLRSIIYIRRAKDSDFGQYNCSVWNEYGFQSQIITLQKQTNILSPLVLTLSGIIGFGVIFVLVSSLLVFICIRSQRLSGENSLAPKKLECTNEPRTMANGSVVTDGATLEEYKINTLGSLEKNVLMKNTIMKITGSNQVLTTLTNTANEMNIATGNNNSYHHINNQNGGCGLPIYTEYDYNNGFQTYANNDLITANGNVMNGGGGLPHYNYHHPEMATYASHYVPVDYVPDTSVNDSENKAKGLSSLNSYYQPELPTNPNPNHVYSTVKKNHNHQQQDSNKNSSTTNYATLLSPAANNNNSTTNVPNGQVISSTTNNNTSSSTSNKTHDNPSPSYANTSPIRKSNKTDPNPYGRPMNGNVNGLPLINHYSNIDPGMDRLLGNGSGALHHHHHHHPPPHHRYKTNSLGGGSSSSGVISTGGSSPGHSPVGSVSGGAGGPNGTHV